MEKHLKKRYRCCEGHFPQFKVLQAGEIQDFTKVILLMEEILHQSIGSLPYYLQGFIHPRWCRISSINSLSFEWCLNTLSVTCATDATCHRHHKWCQMTEVSTELHIFLAKIIGGWVRDSECVESLSDTVDGRNPKQPPGMVKNPVNDGIIIILGGAGFCPSTVCVSIC